jgi:hypothetical protein
MGTLSVLNTIIPAGESLSNPIDCSGGNAVRITFPTSWTPGGNLTIQISTDGNGYNDLYDASGNEVTIPVILGAAVPIAPPPSRRRSTAPSSGKNYQGARGPNRNRESRMPSPLGPPDFLSRPGAPSAGGAAPAAPASGLLLPKTSSQAKHRFAQPGRISRRTS